VRMRVDLCVKCIREHRGGKLLPKDRDLLKNRMVTCPHHHGEEELKEPPLTCPFRLEHVVDSETPNGPDDWFDPKWQESESGLFIPLE